MSYKHTKSNVSEEGTSCESVINFHIKNIAIIEEAYFSIGNKMVIAGRNNLGKSIVNKIIYFSIQTMIDFSNSSEEDWRDILKDNTDKIMGELLNDNSEIVLTYGDRTIFKFNKESFIFEPAESIKYDSIILLSYMFLLDAGINNMVSSNIIKAISNIPNFNKMGTGMKLVSIVKEICSDKITKHLILLDGVDGLLHTSSQLEMCKDLVKSESDIIITTNSALTIRNLCKYGKFNFIGFSAEGIIEYNAKYYDYIMELDKYYLTSGKLEM